jgi:hypothetical protein
MQLSRYDRNYFCPYLIFLPSTLGTVIPKRCITFQNNGMKERENKRRGKIRKGVSENINLAESLVLVVIG